MAETTKRDKQQQALAEVWQHEQGHNTQRKILDKHFFSIKAEEAWLNELLAHGWRLVHYSDEEFGATTYTFEPTDVVSGHYKLDFVSFANREDFEDYEQLWQKAAGSSLRKMKRTKSSFYFHQSKSRYFRISNRSFYVTSVNAIRH